MNRPMMDEVVQAKKETSRLNLPPLGYAENCQAVDILDGMPMIAIIIAKKLAIFHHAGFTFKSISTEHIIIIDENDFERAIGFLVASSNMHLTLHIVLQYANLKDLHWIAAITGHDFD